MRKFAIVFAAALFCAPMARASALDEVLNPDQIQSSLISLVGRTVHSVEIKFNGDLSKETEKQFKKLQGKPLDLTAIRELIHWFNETIRDTRIELRAAKSSAGIDLIVEIISKRKISSIEFLGNNNFEPADLQALVAVNEGDDFEEQLLEAARRKILEFYRNAGFLQSDVKINVLDPQKVQFVISEGKAAVIRDIQITDISIVNDKREKNLLRQSALDAFGIKSGDRLDRKEIKEGVTRLKEWLRSRDFLMSKEPIVNSVIYEGGNSARLDISIVYGPRIRFGFRNNERFSYKELLTAIAEVQEVGIGSDYLETVKAKITEIYHEVGLVNLKLETIVREDPAKGYRYVSFVIDEGKRVRIEHLNFEGIYNLPKDKAMELFLSFSPSIVRRYFFQDAGIRSAGDLLAEHLRSMGFLSARLDLVKYHFNEKHDRVDVDLYFSEGVQTFVSSVKINGAQNLAIDEIRKILAVEEQKPFNVFAFEKGISQIKERYKNLGYLTIEITNESKGQIVKYGNDQSSVDIMVDIHEGPLIRVGDIIVRGNKQTHARVITRELPFIKGDILSKALQTEAEENIRKLNLFTSVIFRPVERPDSPEIRDILILVEEGIPGAIEFGPGYRNDLGLRFFAGASYQNLGGWHRGVNALAVVNRRLENYQFLEYRINLGFREPYFAGWRVTLFTNVEFLRRMYSSFSATILKGTSELRRELTKHVTGTLAYSYERDRFFNVKNPLDDGLHVIGAVTPGIIFDSRNDVFNPASGVFSISRFELASHVFGSQPDVGYYRITTNNSAYIGLAPDLVLGFAANFGFERSNLQGKEIPTIKLFRLGGTGSVRGYQEDALEVDSQTVVNGTLSLLTYRSELRFPIDGDLGGAAFWDAGNLYIDSIIPFNLRHSLGVGLRYKTPVGPVSLDFARKLGSVGPRGDGVNTKDLDAQRVHFSIGSF